MRNLKVLIINPPIRLNDKPRNIPHGLAILANMIRKKAGINPKFIDINAHRYSNEQVQSILRSVEFDVVLIGGLIPVYKRIILYADMIKSINPNAVIIAGGSAAMSVPYLMLNNSKVDVICAGEGERAVVDLLNGLKENHLKELTHVKGFYFKVDGRISYSGNHDLLGDLDSESDLPAYDLLPMDIYLSNPVVGIGRDTDFISSRGCPFNCTFCYQPWGRKFRAHSVSFIMDAFRHLKDNYNIDFISFQDDEFMADKIRVKEFCEQRNRYFPDLLWSCTGRANIVSRDEDIIKLMKDSGCTLISCGFESGSQRMLDRMHKTQTIEEMEKTVRIFRKYKLPVPASFIIGMPGEDKESCRETIDFCLRNKISLDSLMFATPYPGSEIFDFALKTKRINADNPHEFIMRIEDARDFIINLTDSFSDEELIKAREDAMRLTKENYNRFITMDETMTKMRALFGPVMSRAGFDEKDLEHRMKHGGMCNF